MASLALGEVMLDNAVDAAAARAASQARTQLAQVVGLAGGNHLHVAVFGVAHPAAQVQLRGLALHKPAKADPLHAALDEEVENQSYLTSESASLSTSIVF